MVAAGATLQAISPDMLPRIWRISCSRLRSALVSAGCDSSSLRAAAWM
jgi:hypothetical protein